MRVCSSNEMHYAKCDMSMRIPNVEHSKGMKFSHAGSAIYKITLETISYLAGPDGGS